MRTTVRIDDDLLAELKERARAEGSSLTQLLNRLLRTALATKKPPPRRVELHTFDMGEPGVDLERALALAAALEDDELLRKLGARK